MNLPNKLTVLRVILIPVFVFFLMTKFWGSTNSWVALAVFCAASFTDFLDGNIARKYNLVTNFGKFMDPLADKLLVCSALVCFVELMIVPAWFVIIIIAREFVISGFRLVAADKGVVIAASWWGKWKTAVQMITEIYIMVLMGCGIIPFWRDFGMSGAGINGANSVLLLVATILCWISLVLTVISLMDYLIKNKDVMKDDN